MNKLSQPASPACRYEEGIPAYLQGELTPKERRDFEQHLPSCSSCPARMQEYRRLIQVLQSPLPPVPERDLAPDVLARIPAAAWGRSQNRWSTTAALALGIAAAILFAVLVGAIFQIEKSRHDRQVNISPAEELPQPAGSSDYLIAGALDWLRATQEPDGYWEAAKHGAQKNYTPGITALAALAFLNCAPDAFHSQYAENLNRSLNYLLSLQDAQGQIGPLCSGTPYNQGMATLALLEAYSRQKNDDWKPVLDRAVRYIQSTQRPAGGWGYPRESGHSMNTSITAWQLLALLKAETLGWPVQANVDKGLAWLKSMVDQDGRIGYSRVNEYPYGYATLTAAGALCLLSASHPTEASPQMDRILQTLFQAVEQKKNIDYYQSYFMVRALRATGDTAAEDLIDRIQKPLTVCQARSGAYAGSYEPNDQWSKAGGRIYATAMAALSLQTTRTSLQ